MAMKIQATYQNFTIEINEKKQMEGNKVLDVKAEFDADGNSLRLEIIVQTKEGAQNGYLTGIDVDLFDTQTDPMEG